MLHNTVFFIFDIYISKAGIPTVGIPALDHEILESSG